MRAPVLVSILVMGSGAWSPAPATACSSATCSLVGRADEGRLGPGRFRLELSFRHVRQGRRLYGAHALEVWGASDPPVLRPRVDYELERLIQGYHQEYFARTEATQVDLSYGLTTRAVVVVSLPIVTHVINHFHVAAAGATTGPHLGEPGGRLDFETGGLGDAQVTLRYALPAGFGAGAALKLATGGDARLDENGTIADPMSQPGSGALALVGTLQYGAAPPVLGVTWGASASFEHPLANGRGYRFGDEAFLAATATRSVKGALAATLQLKASQSARNTYRGTPSTSTGSTALYVSPGLRTRIPGRLALFGNVQVPVYQRVNEGQLGVDVVLQVGVSRTF